MAPGKPITNFLKVNHLGLMWICMLLELQWIELLRSQIFKTNLRWSIPNLWWKNSLYLLRPTWVFAIAQEQWWQNVVEMATLHISTTLQPFYASQHKLFQSVIIQQINFEGAQYIKLWWLGFEPVFHI